MSEPAKTFGRYRLIRKIAQGGMAEIFLAKFRGASGFEKKVIIKRILPRFSQNQEFIKMLVQEAKLAVQLHHANVVQIHDLGRVRDAYFISMEYIKGRDLRTVTSRLIEKGERMPQQIAVFIAREMCKGLDYAHSFVNDEGISLSLVHRDISPPNILLSLDGEVKIIDFGIAKATAKATDTQAGVFKGKFAYMSPEQASGKRIDRRTDIFATGLVLYEMLTNVKLLDAENDMATLEKAKNIDQVDLKLEKFGFPGELSRIIRRALAGDVDHRYQTAGEMARELTIFLNTRYPTFTEVDVGRFMRKLFNLDRRPSAVDDSDASLIPNVGGASDWVDDRPASMRTTQNLAALGLSRPAPPPRQQESGVWALEEELEADLGSDLEVRTTGPVGGMSGGVALAADAQSPEWVSQVGSEGWSSALVGDTPSDGGVTLSPELDAGVDGTLRSDAPAQLAEREARSRRAAGRGLAMAVAGAALALLLVGFVAAPSWSVTGLPRGLRAVRHDLRQALSLSTEAVVQVAVRPAEAQISVDGAQEGAGPLEIFLSTGVEHRVDARLAGFTPGAWSVTPELDGDVLRLEEGLAPQPVALGSIALASEPAGARILVNGVERPGARTPAVVDGLPVGEDVTVALALDGYLPQEVKVAPGAEAGEPVTVALQPRPVSLEVISHPAGARVFLDDRPLDELTPVAGALLQPGASYHLRVEKDGHQPYEEELTTSFGRDISLRLSLAPLPALAPVAPSPAAPAPQQAPPTQPVAAQGGKKAPASGAPRAAHHAGPAEEPAPPAPATELRALQAAAAREVQQQLDSARVNVLVLPDTLKAEVYLNGELLGRAPIQNRRLGPGQYTLRLKSTEANLDRVFEKVILAEDAGKTLTWEFEIAAPAP